MRTISLLLTLLLASTAYPQIKADTVYALGQPIVIECTVPVPTDGTLHTIWETTSGLSSREFGSKLALWTANPGKYSVSVTTQVTREVKLNGETLTVLVPDTFKKYVADFTVIGSTPTPDPLPEPDVPTPPSPIAPDKFDNIAQRVNKWVAELVPATARSKRTELSDLYTTLANNLESGVFISINDSNNYFNTERNKILSPPSIAEAWGTFGTNLSNDLTPRKLTNRLEVIEYYRAVSLGLKGK